MCTIIVTIRSVLWYVVSLAGTLLVLVALFTNRWLNGGYGSSNLMDAGSAMDSLADAGRTVMDEGVASVLDHHVGLFLDCTQPTGQKFFEGECVPDIDKLVEYFTNLDEEEYPHAWRGALICFVFGLGLMVITDLFALMTLCCRSCICCSVFTVCGSIQSFAGILFTLGCVAYPAGWGSTVVKNEYCGGESSAFMLGPSCTIGIAFWLAVAGTACTWVASSLAIWAYQSTKSARCELRQDEGEKCICLP